MSTMKDVTFAYKILFKDGREDSDRDTWQIRSDQTLTSQMIMQAWEHQMDTDSIESAAFWELDENDECIGTI